MERLFPKTLMYAFISNDIAEVEDKTVAIRRTPLLFKYTSQKSEDESMHIDWLSS